MELNLRVLVELLFYFFYERLIVRIAPRAAKGKANYSVVRYSIFPLSLHVLGFFEEVGEWVAYPFFLCRSLALLGMNFHVDLGVLPPDFAELFGFEVFKLKHNIAAFSQGVLDAEVEPLTEVAVVDE